MIDRVRAVANAAEHQEASADIPSEHSRRLDLFAKRLFARLPADLSDSFPAHKRLIIAQSALDFFTIRSEPPAVRTLAADGDGTAAVETLMPDCPFIVDSILEYFRKKEIPVRTLLHPLFSVARDEAGAIVSFEQANSAEHVESFTHAEIEVIPPTPSLPTIAADLTRVLTQVQEATGDFNAMTARALQICDETAPLRELVEIRDFLRWLVQGGFIFLGYRRYRVEPRDGRNSIVVQPGSGLGIMRDESRSRYAAPVNIDALPDAHRKLLFDGPPFIIGKTGVESEVHRRAPMDDVTLRRSDASGKPNGFDRFIGLFTTKAFSEEAQHIPVLRAKLNEVVAAEGVQPGTHDYKALVAAFNSFPKEELFRARLPELRSQLRLVLDVKSEADVRLVLETDAVRGNVIALVIMPRDRFSADVRMRIQSALAARLGGRVIYYYLALGESYTARLHFCFAASPPRPDAVPEMEAEVERLARSWDDLLREALVERFGQARAHVLASRWIAGLGPHYKSSTPVELAIGDIDELERLSNNRGFSVVIGPAADAAARDVSELRLYELGEAPILSELFPILHNFGISIVSEEAHELTPSIDGKPRFAHIQAFHARGLDGRPLEQMPGAALIA